MKSNIVVVVLSALALTCIITPTEARLRFPFCPTAHEPAPTVEDHCKPWFCHGLDCPDFNRTKVEDGWEEREYESAKWVGTKIHCAPFPVAVPKGFGRLFGYLKGANLNHTRLEMTAPVVTQLYPKYGFRESERNYTVAFYLSKTYQDDPPIPRDRALEIHSSPASKLYVRSFNGWASEQVALSVAARLTAALEAAGKEVNKEWFYLASYDPPFRLCHRHNEVWMLPKDASVGDAMEGLQLSLA